MEEHEVRVHLTEREVQERVAALAREISEDYSDVERLLLVGVLKGAFVFLADLARRLTVPNTVDFVALSSYEDETVSSGDVRLVMELRAEVAGQHILVVEDIVDSGRTLDYLRDRLMARGPASLQCCTLLRKRRQQEVPVEVEYVGFEIADVWVVGCGLDYAERYRTLPYIGVVSFDSREG